MYIYIYIYVDICCIVCIRTQGLAGQNITPELTKVKFYWNMPLNIHGKFPVTIHWESYNSLENTAEK